MKLDWKDGLRQSRIIRIAWTDILELLGWGGLGEIANEKFGCGPHTVHDLQYELIGSEGNMLLIEADGDVSAILAEQEGVDALEIVERYEEYEQALLLDAE
jgi:hypothetical protein